MRSVSTLLTGLALVTTAATALSDDAAEQPVELTDSLGMKFRLIPAGEFVMGSPRDWKHRGRDEGPQHKVRIAKPFYLGVYEVTQGEWKKTMGTEPWKGKEYVQKDDANAASFVSWNDAKAFIKKLSTQSEKYQYRLPTEAEWEYACRAGSTTMFCFGNDQADWRSPTMTRHLRSPNCRVWSMIHIQSSACCFGRER